MSGHARLSPSARHRWQKCPASIRVSQQYEGEGRSSPAAIDGTHSHALLEHCLTHKLNPTDLVGTGLSYDGCRITVDEERARRVQLAIDYIASRVKDAENEVPFAIYTEKTVDPSRLLGRDDMGGTVDVHIIQGRTLEVIDYKDGMDPVSAMNNPQMQQYVYGILAEHVAEQGTFPFDTVMMTIIQPKLALKGYPPISSHLVTIGEVAEWYPQLIEEAAATDDPNAPFVPGEKQCKWCSHAANCTASVSYSLGKAGIKFGKMNFAEDAAQKDSTVMSDEELCAIVEAAPMIRKMIENAEDEAVKRIKGGHPVPGLKLVAGVGRRQWKDEDEVVAQRLIRMGVPKGSVWETKLVSPAGAEKLRWSKRDGTVKQLSERQLKTVMEELVGKSEGKLTVVPAADRRPAVEFGNLGEMFAPADAEPVPSWLS
jgi:hypothetical protein